MEKQRVNDTVVRIGNLILKARVHVAHRLSSKIRALRAKKDEKFGKRIERLLLEIAYLKTLSKSGTRKAVARKMLLNTDDVAARIELENTSPEERAFCRLCKTKFIENFISKFREENVDWKYWVPPLLAMWEKKVEMKKTRILKPESSEEPKRLSVREIAEARKRKMASDDNGEDGGGRKRAKKIEGQNDRITTETKNKKRTAKDRFNVEPIKQSGGRLVEPAADSDDSSDVEGVGQGETSNPERDTNGEELGSTAEDSEARERSSSPEVRQVPFRPYAPKHFGRDSESGESASGDDDDDENDRNGDHVGGGDGESSESESSGDSQQEESQGNCDDGDGDNHSEEDGSEDDRENAENEDEDSEDDSVDEATPLRKKPGSSSISVRQLESGSDEDRNKDSDQDEEESSDEEQSDDDSDEEQSDEDSDEEQSDEDESDREREFEERIEKKFKANGSQTTKIPVSSYEPDSSEEEFPAQEQTDRAGNGGSAGDENEDDARASSFFLRKGEQPEDVESRTIPKDKAPGLNRRQRRGHEKQRSSTAANQDDSDDAEPRSNITFGKDFRPRKSFQRQDRPQAFGRNKPYDRNSPGARGGQNERFNRNGRFQSGTNPRASLPARFDRSPAQGGRGKPMNFSRDQKFDSRTSRDERRPHSNAERQSGRTDRRFSERPAPRSAQPMDRSRGDQRRDNIPFSAQRTKTQDTPRPGAEEKLHPSWLAKKKLSASLNQPFQGKKIVFDD